MTRPMATPTTKPSMWASLQGVAAVAAILSLVAAALLSLPWWTYSRALRCIVVGIGVFLGPMFWPIGLTGSTPFEYWPYVLVNGALNVMYLAGWTLLIRRATRLRRRLLLLVAAIWLVAAAASAALLALNA